MSDFDTLVKLVEDSGMTINVNRYRQPQKLDSESIVELLFTGESKAGDTVYSIERTAIENISQLTKLSLHLGIPTVECMDQNDLEYELSEYQQVNCKKVLEVDGCFYKGTWTYTSYSGIDWMSFRVKVVSPSRRRSSFTNERITNGYYRLSRIARNC